MNYVVLEMQTTDEDVTSTIVNVYDTRETAESAYHTVLASAALTTLKLHTAVLLDTEGLVLSRESYPLPKSETT